MAEPSASRRRILRAVGQKRQQAAPSSSHQETSPMTSTPAEALDALIESFGEVSLGPSEPTGPTVKGFDVFKDAYAEPGDEEWLAASPLPKLTHEKALAMISEWLDIAEKSVAKINEGISKVDKLSGDADEQMTTILTAAERQFRDMTWRSKQTRLYLRTTKEEIRIPDRTKVWTRAREILHELELAARTAADSWPDPAREALAEVKRNTNTRDERPRQQPAQPKTAPSKPEDGWQKTLDNINQAHDLLSSFKPSLDENRPIEDTGLRDEDVRQEFMETGTNLDFFYRWSTQSKPAPYALRIDGSGSIDYNAWLKQWTSEAPTKLDSEQLATVRTKVPKAWVQEKNIRRKINEMSEMAKRLAEKYPTLDDYLSAVSKVLKALEGVIEAVPLMWWEKPNEVKPPEIVESRGEIVRADGTAYSAKKSKAKK